MGYELHITRRKSHWDSGDDISKDQFIACIGNDPDFKYPSEIGEDYAEWSSPTTDYESWLRWDDGCIHTKNPMPEFVDKMVAMAKQLDAHVQGDDLEIYESSTRVIQPDNKDFPAADSLPTHYTLPKSRLHIDGEKLVRKNKDGTAVASFKLSDIDKAEVKKGIEPVMIVMSLVFIILTWSCFYFIQHSPWKWAGVAFALLAFLSLLSMQKIILSVKTKHGTVELPLYDQPEDNYAFAVTVNMMVFENNASSQ